MKKNEIRVGGHYRASVSGKETTVRVDQIRQCGGIDRDKTMYDVTNLTTGRKTTFRSAMKFRREVKPVKTNVESVTGRVLAGEKGLTVAEEEAPGLIRAAIRNRNGTTTPVMGTPTADGGLIVGDFRHEPGTWFASKPSQGEEAEEAPATVPFAKTTTTAECPETTNHPQQRAASPGGKQPPTGTLATEGPSTGPCSVTTMATTPTSLPAAADAPPAGLPVTPASRADYCQGDEPDCQEGGDPGDLCPGCGKEIGPRIARHHQCRCPSPEVEAKYPRNICKLCGGETDKPSGPWGAKAPFAEPSCSPPTIAPSDSSSGPAPSTPLASLLRQSIASKQADNAPHLIVEARAGTGKTTTLVEGLKVVKSIPSALTPSPQQQAVWDAMALSAGKVGSVGFVAFNKSIATELQRRVPAGCDACTMHSLGFAAVRKAFGGVNVNQYRVRDILADLLRMDGREMMRQKPLVVQAVEQLVGLCKMNLTGLDVYGKGGSGADAQVCIDEALGRLASHYEVDLNGSSREVFALVPQVLERCKDVRADNCIDYDDMVWLPCVLNLPTKQYDLLLIDEAQDLSKVQQELTFRAGKRLIFCGDERQAIYGFAGADAKSMQNLRDRLAATERGLVRLPLTVTRRCGRAIVSEAQKIVKDFEAHESNPEGKITTAVYPIREDKEEVPWEKSYMSQVQPGDFILCRVNAPLVGNAFRFIKRGIRANIQGRDIGAGLVSTVKKLKAGSVAELVGKIDDWLHKETAKENAKRNPSDAKLISLQDRADCLVCFTEGAETVDAVVRKIESVFTDDKNAVGIKLSSIHKAKGLESSRVFLLEPKGATVPHPMAKSQWQVGQEWNLRYVAVTRAIEELVYVS